MGIETLIPLLGSVIGGLGGIFGGGEGNNKMTDIISQIQKMIPNLMKGTFSTDQLLQYATNAKKNIQTSGDIAAAGLAPSISERSMAAGVPEGQPSNSMYVSELAPIKAQGIQTGEQTFLDFLSKIESMDAQRKNSALQALGMSLGGASNLEDSNWFGKGLSGALQGGNLGFSMLGNLGQYDYWKNKKQVSYSTQPD